MDAVFKESMPETKSGRGESWPEAKRLAIVTFDDSRTSVQELTRASADAGHPASVKE